MFIYGLVIGSIIGVISGIFVMCLCIVSADSDKQMMSVDHNGHKTVMGGCRVLFPEDSNDSV